MFECCSFSCCKNAAGYDRSPRADRHTTASTFFTSHSEESSEDSPQLMSSEPSWDSISFPPADYGAAAARVHEQGLPKRKKKSQAGSPTGGQTGLLAPVVALFERSTEGLLDGKGEAEDVLRAPFVEGVEAYAKVLDAMGGGMGNYLTSNTAKMRKSKANATEQKYRLWLQSELPVHAAAGYRGYVDDSAWMANLWIGWTMEFFVEFYACLHEGQETKSAVDVAYRKTLYNHHNMFQRTAFNAAVKQLPERGEILRKLKGGADEKTAVRELGAFVAAARPVVGVCLRVNDELSATLKEAEQKARAARM